MVHGGVYRTEGGHGRVHDPTSLPSHLQQTLSKYTVIYIHIFMHESIVYSIPAQDTHIRISDKYYTHSPLQTNISQVYIQE